MRTYHGSMRRRSKSQPIHWVGPVRNPKNSIDIAAGSEGPQHDPYHYDEITFNGRNGETVLHSGLACWCKHNGELVAEESHRKEHEDPAVAFERLTGLSPQRAMVLVRELPFRKHARKCKSRRFHSSAGYPGESFLICDTCGDIIDSSMDYSAIE